MRRNLTSNERAFRSNPRSFLNMITESPINLEISDGLGGTVKVVVSPITATIQNPESVPPGLVSVGREATNPLP